MKKKLICIPKMLLAFAFTFSLLLTSKTYAQLPSEYPFRSKIDESQNIYVTGYKPNNTGINEILIQKLEPGGGGWVRTFVSSFSNGNDKGMDVVIDEDYNVYVAGYVYNSDKDYNYIMLLKYNSAGTLQGTPFTYDIGMDNKAMAMAMDDNQNIYLCGYTTSKYGDKNFITMKFNSTLDLVENPKIHDIYSGDDIATSILVDAGYVYVLGYSYQGASYKNDLLLITYEKSLAHHSEYLVSKEGDEKPTSFIMANKSLNSTVKSKFIGGGLTERRSKFLSGQMDYFVYYFDSNLPNDPLVWSNYFGSNLYDDASTSIAKKSDGDIIATGYIFNGTRKYDFGTVRLNKITGSNIWTQYYDKADLNNVSGNDKASSVAISSSGKIYVTGYSEHSQNKYVTVMYSDDIWTPVQEWAQEFEPDLSSIPVPVANYVSESHVDSDNNIIVVAMGWTENYSRYDIVKYDSAGNTLFTTNDAMQPGTMNNLQSDSGPGKVKIDNYPNPFNPSTTIKYSLNADANVRISVYDLSGRLISQLINGIKSPGEHSVVFDGSSLASGVYFYKMEVTEQGSNIPSYTETKRMMMIK